jgi:hypothetical protein
MSKALYIQLDVWNKFAGWYRLFDGIERMLTKVNCIFVPDLCLLFVDRLIYSSKIGLDDPKKYQVLMGHMPGGVGLKNLFSYFQTFLTGKFQDWDYDMEFLAIKSNWEEYGQAKPPQINLKNIRNTSVPVAMFVGTYDELVTLKDSRWLRDQLLDGDKQ